MVVLVLATFFIVLPWLELVILFRLGGTVGVPETLGIILLTGVAGAALAKRQGFQAIVRIREALQNGRLPGTEIVDGVLILCAGLLLVTPGLITDSVGFLLLVPQVRQAARRLAFQRLRPHFRVVHTSQTTGGTKSTPPDQDVIDVQAVHLDD